MSDVIRVNFGRPIPVFPLRDAVLLPHAVQPLHIFEERYRQMVNDALDGNGQIAMATLASDEPSSGCGDMPKLMPAVCIGQIIEHQSLPDGRYNILLHGVCRGRINTLSEPSDDRLYCSALLKPLEKMDEEPTPMPKVRSHLKSILNGPRLCNLRCVETVLEWFDRDEVTTHALLELVGFALVRDSGLRYKLLQEPKPKCRAEIITTELRKMDRLIGQALRQSHNEWPRGVSWN